MTVTPNNAGSPCRKKIDFRVPPPKVAPSRSPVGPDGPPTATHIEGQAMSSRCTEKNDTTITRGENVRSKLCRQGGTRPRHHAQRVVRHTDSIRNKDPSPSQNSKLKMRKASEVMSQRTAMITRGEHKLSRMLGRSGTQ